MKTLLLDRDSWDLVLTAAGDIAIASEPYARAQDVASAVRTFRAECWYDTTLGVPHFEQILGRVASLESVKALLVQAALTVPGVVSAQCVISSVAGRTLSGSIPFVDVDGVTSTVGLQ